MPSHPHPNPLGASSSPVPIQSYLSFFLSSSISPTREFPCRWGRLRRHVSPRCRLGHTSVRVGGRHTLAAPACVCSPPSLPPRTSSPLPQPAVPCCCPCSSGHLPSAAASPPFPTADQDPSRLRLGTRLTKIVS